MEAMILFCLEPSDSFPSPSLQKPNSFQQRLYILFSLLSVFSNHPHSHLHQSSKVLLLFFKNIYLFILLCRVLVVARGIFVVACRIFLVATCKLLVAACVWGLVP